MVEKTKEEIEAVIQTIKARMPDTYANIQLKVKEIGNEAYELVRRGIRGEGDCFYAFENFNVVGTPFKVNHEIAATIAVYMVEFGSTFCTLFGDKLQADARKTAV